MTLQIKHISLPQTYDIRKRVLRNNTDDESMYKWEQPTDKGVFHLGAFIDDELVGIASFYQENLANNKDVGYRLRGIGLEPKHQDKGIGRQILKAGIEYIKKSQADYIWCNSRIEVVEFYLKKGFARLGEEFIIPKIGKCQKMIKLLKDNG